MPELNFDEVPEMDDFSPLPEGEYLCEVSNAEEGITSTGKERIALVWMVLQPEKYEGKLIYDNLFFTEKTAKRIKFVCSRLGLPTTGKVNIKSADFFGKRAWVTTEIHEYNDDFGKEKKSNKVTFAGYRQVTEEEEKRVGYDDLPF